MRVVAASAHGRNGGSHERCDYSPDYRPDTRGAIPVGALLGGQKMSDEKIAEIVEQVAWIAAVIVNDYQLTSKEAEKRINRLVAYAVKQITEGME